MMKLIKNLSKVVRLLEIVATNKDVQTFSILMEKKEKEKQDTLKELQNLKARIVFYRRSFLEDKDYRSQFINEFPPNW